MNEIRSDTETETKNMKMKIKTKTKAKTDTNTMSKTEPETEREFSKGDLSSGHYCENRNCTIPASTAKMRTTTEPLFSNATCNLVILKL